MQGAGAKALRQDMRNRMKNAGRLMSKWDMVTYASRKVGKSLILQGLIAHTEGFEFYT